jgi:4-hydroxyphenylacetate 3-monooxygenase
MIRMGEQYRDSIRDGRQVWMNGERVKDVTAHPMFRPLVDVRARIYDMQHDPRFVDALSYCSEVGEVCAVVLKLPRTRADWCAKRTAVEAVLNDISGVVTRVGDETVGEMWSLFDGQDILDEVDPVFSETSAATSIASSGWTRFMSRPIPTPRAIDRSGRRSRIPTCFCMS